MRDVALWKVLLAFVLTFVGVYALAAWRGPLGFYDTGVFSIPQNTLPSVGWVFVVTLVMNVIWWVVLLLPSSMKRSMPA